MNGLINLINRSLGEIKGGMIACGADPYTASEFIAELQRKIDEFVDLHLDVIDEEDEEEIPDEEEEKEEEYEREESEFEEEEDLEDK